MIKLDDFVPCKPDPSDLQGLGVARTRDGMPQALYAKPHGKETWVTCLIMIIHWAKFPEICNRLYTTNHYDIVFWCINHYKWPSGAHVLLRFRDQVGSHCCNFYCLQLRFFGTKPLNPTSRFVLWRDFSGMWEILTDPSIHVVSIIQDHPSFHSCFIIHRSSRIYIYVDLCCFKTLF